MKNKKIKILVILNKNLYYVEGAYSNRARGLFEGLAQRCVEVHILISDGIWEWKEYFYHKQYRYPENIFIHYIKVPYLMRFIKRFKLGTLKKFIIINKQKTIQNKIKFDFGWTTVGMDSKISKESFALFRKENAKIIQEMSEFPDLMIKNKQEYNNYLELVIPQIDILFIMTRGLLEFYKKYANEKARLFHLPMTVDFKRFNIKKTKKKSNEIVISYVGLMNNKKDGVDILIKAFSIIIKKFPNAVLQLIGPKKLESDFDRQLEIIKKFNIENNIRYLGRVSREKIPELLVNSDCLVLARPSSKQAEYGFPTKLGEYLATGNPVVVTSVGEISLYLKDNVNAYIAKPDDFKDFADKVINVLKNREKANEIGAEGLKIAQNNFDAEIQSNFILKVLQDNL